MTALALCLGASPLLAQTQTPATVTAAPISDVTGDSGWFMIGRTVNDNIPGDINGVGLGISIDDAPGKL